MINYISLYNHPWNEGMLEISKAKNRNCISCSLPVPRGSGLLFFSFQELFQQVQKILVDFDRQ